MKENQKEPLTKDAPETPVEEATQKERRQEDGLEAQLKAKEKEAEELREKYLRLYAEFDNFKKRTLKEKIEMMKTAAQDTMQALLPVLDDFDRAKRNAEDEHTTEFFSEGVTLVYNKLYSALKAKGLEPMKSDGESFDPELHEALTEVPVPDESMKGKVIDTIERGYLLNERIIRHAKVVVGK